MKTEDLISALAADTIPQRSVGGQLARSVPLAIGVSLMVFALFWGTRPDLWAALGSYAVLKTLGPLALALAALPFVLALVHPGMRPARHGRALAVVIMLTAAVFVTVFARQGYAALISALSTDVLAVCLLSIPALALPLLIAVLWGLSSGAATRPKLAGAAAGLVAGGLAASVYSLYCDQDTVLFVLPGYSTGIAFVVLAGAICGPRVLKW